jgi:hypothetical protein
METLCHRCGNTLHEGQSFCPHCGVPQLVVDTSESAGPPQPSQRLAADPSRVEWRVAITYAVLLSIPVGLLSALAGMSSLFVIAGGFGAIALYRKRTEAFTDGSVGWRVGAILGAAAASVASLADGIRLLIERYLLHHGADIDGQFANVAQQLADQALRSNSQAMQQAPELVHNWASFWLSADGHAAIQLLTAFMVSAGMVLFAATGGAIAGRILSVRPRTQRTL